MKAKLCLLIYPFILTLSAQIGYSQQVKNLWLDSEQLIAPFSKSDASQHLKKQLEVPNDYEFRIRTINGTKNVTDFTDDLGYTHERYTQYYKGIKIEHSDIRLHYRGDVFVSANGEYVDAQNIDISVKISKEEAIQQAKKYVNAKEYMWEDEAKNNELKNATSNETLSFYPKPEVIICKNDIDAEDATFHIAYKVDIYAKEPLRHDYVYIDAKTGNVLNTLPILVDATGTAQTRYSGYRAISTQQNGTTYRLKDYSRGGGIETYNLNRSTSTLAATDFTDNNNDWTASEHHNANKDDAALDAHWGTMMTYDYFKSIHNRNSYDNNGSVLKNYVHYSNNYENAGWDMNLHHMIYGDGRARFDAITALDVIAHEIAHGVCQYSANLVYSGQSGAINESLSDIWAACVENWATTNKQTWLIGEDIMLQNVALRSMNNPTTCSQPDTYGGGAYWTGPNAGVHTNSGIMNHWFYILSVGKSGTNGVGNSYNTTGIGIDKAAKIVYRAETVYMTANTTFADARAHTIKAAVEIYGFCSPEAIAVTNAWYAVGVGNAFVYPSNTINIVSGNFNSGTTTVKENVNIINVTGSTTIKSGATLILDACDKVTIEPSSSFTVEAGASFIIK